MISLLKTSIAPYAPLLYGAALFAGVVWVSSLYVSRANLRAEVQQARAELSDYKASSEAAYALATAKTLKAERAAASLRDDLEKQYHANSKRTNALLADNRRLAAELGGLRDPGHDPSGGGALPGDAQAPERPGDPAASGRLSAAASSFLLDFAARCDETADYARACYDWAEGLKKLNP